MVRRAHFSTLIIAFAVLLLVGVSTWLILLERRRVPDLPDAPVAAETPGSPEQAEPATLRDHPKEPEAPEPLEPPKAPDPPVERHRVSAGMEHLAPRLYLVLDDAGLSLDELRRFAPFPETLTLAVLPHLPFSSDAVHLARAAGHEVILHQPMEAINGEDPGPGAIFTHFEDREIRAILEENLQRYPDVAGVNNHMGSRATSDERVMEIVLETVEQSGRYFLDSRTIHTSVVPIVAARLGIPVLERHVFLDHERTREYIRGQLDYALTLARRHGFAIMIGHVTVPETAEVLLERAPAIVAAGFRFLPLSAALKYGDLARIMEADGAGPGY